MHVYGPHFYCLFHFFLFTNLVSAALVNVTVDDLAADPVTGKSITYSENGWTIGQACKDCQAKLNETYMYLGTWHDGSYYPNNSFLPPTGPLNATFKFTGSAIYAFCVIASSIFTPTGYTNMTFYIDGDRVGQYEYKPNGTQGYTYNVSVYSNTSLPHGPHEFVLENGQVGGGGNLSLTLFDYLIYSYDNDLDISATCTTAGPTTTITAISSSPASGSTKFRQRGVIIAAAVGSIGGIATISLVVLVLLRRREAGIQANTVQPFIAQSSTQQLFWPYDSTGGYSLTQPTLVNEPGTSSQHYGPGSHPPEYDQISPNLNATQSRQRMGYTEQVALVYQDDRYK